jgi:ribosomal protein S18 acetylase RimI-like enzyme
MELLALAPNHVEGCLDVIRSLPEWFGYPGALEGVEAALTRGEGFVAVENDAPAAFVTTTRLYEESVEITYLAVHRAARRRGLGRALLAAASDAAETAGASMLVLLTLGPSAGSPFYAETVEFYRAVGFARTKELFLKDWGGSPALVMTACLGELRRD